MSDAVTILGAGYTGLTAAYDLARAGHKVSIYEGDGAPGGLAGSFELSPGVWIEKFYHHWFTSDTAVLDLIKDLGISDRVTFLESNTGLYYANSIFRLAKPLDLLRFTPIPVVDRIRTGLMALKARRIDNWKALEDISASDWIRKTAGEKSFETIWKPLLQGKFGPEAEHVSAVWFWNKLKLRGSSRNKKGSEQLAYLAGGFKILTEQLHRELLRLGVEIHLGTPVDSILSENGSVSAISVGGKTIPVSRVLATIPLPPFLNMTPGLPAAYKQQHGQIRFLGNVCLVLRLKRSLSSTYWMNVADPSFPFVGIIEHTNFDSKDNYGGEHIAYMSKYLRTSEDLFKFDDQALFDYCVPYIKRMFPDFDPHSWVIGFKAWRAHYSQPVITKHYSKLIPDFETPIKNLFLSTMAQVYPEDRGTNYAVREGRKAAAKLQDIIAGSAR